MTEGSGLAALLLLDRFFPKYFTGSHEATTSEQRPT
jgi:hypothetical protein